MKKILSLCLCFSMIFNILPIKTFAEEKQSLEETIRTQVGAFAKSIDQPNANKKAQDAIIGHGISGNGKKLSVGKSHALTAAIVNSELGKAFLAESCLSLINTFDALQQEEIYSLGESHWNIAKDFYYFLFIYDSNIYYRHSGEGFLEANTEYFAKTNAKNSSFYPKKFSSYDETLKLIIGQIYADIDVKRNITKDKITYNFNVVLWDTFDFDTDNSTAIEDLLGWIGMILFEPFEWESKFNFQIEVPIEKPEENIIFGDSDRNGSVDVMDAYFARLVAAKIVKPTEEQLAFCDVDLDGKITAIDANIIRKYALGIIDKLPIQ